MAPPASSLIANTVQKEPALNENYFGVNILDERAWIVGYYGTISTLPGPGLDVGAPT